MTPLYDPGSRILVDMAGALVLWSMEMAHNQEVTSLNACQMDIFHIHFFYTIVFAF